MFGKGKSGGSKPANHPISQKAHKGGMPKGAAPMTLKHGGKVKAGKHHG